MNRIYRYAMLMSAALLPIFAAAQNLDPTVEVSRAYEGSLVEVHKPAMMMSVPDTVQQFRLDFDYSVFDSPYKGSYEFNPYMASMRPAPSLSDVRNFYLRAGAGYRLHPVADIIWSPDFKKGFRMDVYASHRSYVGDYRNIYLVKSGQGYDLDRVGEKLHGYDLRTDAGVSGRYEWQKGTFDFDLSYLGIHSRLDTLKHEKGVPRSYDSFNASFGVASKAARTFFYDLAFNYTFAEDKAADYLQENVCSINVDLGPQFRTAHRILFNLGAELAQYSGYLDWGTARMNITPHYVYKKGRWHLDAGVRVDFLVGSDDTETLRSVKRQQFVYPDVHVEFTAIRDAMNVYAEATGSTRLNTYSGVVSRNHFADVHFLAGNLLDSEVERLRAVLGLKGRIGSRFSYDLSGGYAGYANSIFDAIVVLPDSRILPAIGYATAQKAFVELDWLLDTERFRFDGNVVFAHYWGFEDALGIFAPASVTGNTSMEYNIRKRIYIGLDCAFASRRHMAEMPAGLSAVSIPAYADLGLSFEYALSRKLSLWARGGNLLNMTIQRTPLYAEGGINFTAGICLNL